MAYPVAHVSANVPNAAGAPQIPANQDRVGLVFRINTHSVIFSDALGTAGPVGDATQYTLDGGAAPAAWYFYDPTGLATYSYLEVLR